MSSAHSSAELLHRSFKLIMGATLIIFGTYFLVDKPVAFYAYNHHINHYDILKWMTYIPTTLESIAPIVLVLIIVDLSRHSLSHFQKTLLAMIINLAVTLQIKEGLKFIFGRYWPATWTNHNPSLIQNHAYGFHLFHSGSAYQSFPSGHTTIIFSVMSILWMVYPKWRWLATASCAAVIIGLLGMDYHFVSDIIAGATLGTITGMYAVYFFGLEKNDS